MITNICLACKKKMTGRSDKVIQALIKGLPNPKWSKTYNMAYIINNKSNLDSIFCLYKSNYN